MVARPLSTSACSVSVRCTSRPALAQAMAMPPPIVPAPTMATDCDGRWRPRRAGPAPSPRRARRRTRRSAPWPVRTARTRRTARARAGTRRRRAAWPPRRWRPPRRAAPRGAACVLAASARPASSMAGSASAEGSLSDRSRVFGGAPGRSAFSRASDTAPATRSPSTIHSIRPARSASLGGDRPARYAHLERLLDADQPRQPLRALRAGDDAQVHFGLAQLGVGGGDAVVAGHGQLEAAAERRAVHRHDHRLGAVLDERQARRACRARPTCRPTPWPRGP